MAEKYSWDNYLDRVEALLFDFVKASSESSQPPSKIMPALSAAQKKSRATMTPHVSILIPTQGRIRELRD